MIRILFMILRNIKRFLGALLKSVSYRAQIGRAVTIGFGTVVSQNASIATHTYIGMGCETLCDNRKILFDCKLGVNRGE
jgi:carbonic anhydrase/acetyltransferase-like protein (isoleucine patch superfamily)